MLRRCLAELGEGVGEVVEALLWEGVLDFGAELFAEDGFALGEEFAAGRGEVDE